MNLIGFIKKNHPKIMNEAATGNPIIAVVAGEVPVKAHARIVPEIRGLQNTRTCLNQKFTAASESASALLVLPKILTTAVDILAPAAEGISPRIDGTVQSRVLDFEVSILQVSSSITPNFLTSDSSHMTRTTSAAACALALLRKSAAAFVKALLS